MESDRQEYVLCDSFNSLKRGHLTKCFQMALLNEGMIRVILCPLSGRFAFASRLYQRKRPYEIHPSDQPGAVNLALSNSFMKSIKEFLEEIENSLEFLYEI